MSVPGAPWGGSWFNTAHSIWGYLQTLLQVRSPDNVAYMGYLSSFIDGLG